MAFLLLSMIHAYFIGEAFISTLFWLLIGATGFFYLRHIQRQLEVTA